MNNKDADCGKGISKRMDNIIGLILEGYSTKFGVLLNVIYEGLCNSATFSRILRHQREADFLLIESILARVGVDVEELECLAGDDDYDLWTERLAIASAMCGKDMEQVSERLTYYEGVIPSKEALHLHRQFVLYYKMKLAEWRGEAPEIVCSLGKEALLLTKSLEEVPCVGKNLYTPMELDILITLMCHRYDRWQESYKVENDLRSIIEYVDYYYNVKRLEEIEGRAWMGLLHLAEEENNMSKLFGYLDKAIACFSGGTGIIRLAQARFLKARYLAKVREGEDGDSDWKESCMEECKMAYCIYRTMGYEKEREEIEEFCRRELTCPFTMQMKLSGLHELPRE